MRTVYDTVLEERHIRAITAQAASDWNLTVTNTRSAIDLSGYTLSASEEWVSPSLSTSTTTDYGASDGWTKSYPGSVRNVYGSPGALTGETGWIADDRSGAFAGFSPYSYADSVLTITASQIDSSIQAQKFAGNGVLTCSTGSTSVTAVGGNFLTLRAGYKLYDNSGSLIGTLASNPASDNAATLTGNAAIAVASGAWQYGNITGNSTALTGGVTSFNWIERQYGYWEWRGQMPPAIAGMLPAFWLLAADGRWPTEIDAQEMGGSNVGVGVQGRTLVPTIHTDPYWPTGAGSDVAVTPTQTLVDDQTSEMHLFGVDVQPTGISYYYDRKLVGTQGAYQGVTSIAVTNGGSGYTSNPTVVFTGGGGTGASATVTRVGNAITAINVAKTGYGYTSAPTISFTGGGGGTGAAATATIATLPDMPLPQFYHRPLYALANLAITDGTGTAAYAGAVSLGTLPKQLKFDYLRHYSKNVSAPTIITGTQAETTTLVIAMTSAGSTPSTGRQTTINDLICWLKSPTQLRFDTGTTGGNTYWNNSNLTPWQALDGLIVHAAHAESAAWINWKNPGTYDLTKSGTPTFTTDRGYTFSGANTEYLESTYDLGSAPQLDPWDHAFGVFTLSAPTNGSNAPIIGAHSTMNLQLASGSFLPVPYGTVGAGTGARTTTKAPGAGLFTVTRGPQYATYVYKDTSLLHAGLVSGTSKPSVLTGSKMRVGAYSGASAVAQVPVAVSFWGRRLMPAEIEWINTGIRAYLTAVGAI